MTESAVRAHDDGTDTWPGLDPRHLTALTSGGIDPEVTRERGYASLAQGDDAHVALMRGESFSGPHRASLGDSGGLLIPVYNPTGARVSAHYRPDVVFVGSDGKERKYLTPFGVGTVLDVHPRNHAAIRDVTVPLYVTEGVKKGDSLTSRGLCAVALSGVWNWKREKAAHPDWDSIPCKGRRVVIVYDADAVSNPDVVQAQESLARWLRDTKLADVRVAVLPGVVNGVAVKGVDDHFTAGWTVADLDASLTADIPEAKEVRREKERAAVNDASEMIRDAPLSDVVCEELLCGTRLYSGALGWLAWDGDRWRPVGDEVVTHATSVFMKEYFNRLRDDLISSGAIATKTGAASVATFQGILEAPKIHRVLSLSKGHPDITVNAGMFDADPDVINTPDGLLCLRTGAVRPHDPSMLVLKSTTVGYVPGARHPDWDAALTALPDPDVRDWFQLRMGQAMTGHMTPDDVMVIMIGGGSNGKSTITDAISRVLGDYAVLVPQKTLMGNPNDHSTEKMVFLGARLALIEELPEGRRLNVTALKNTIGTPRMSARAVYKDNVEWDATHTLFINANYPPLIDEVDHGTWRRLLKLMFPIRYVKPGDPPIESANDVPADGTLRERVARDPGVRVAVMAWLVEGAMRWYAMGRVMPAPPTAVGHATRAWRIESDVLLGYVGDNLVRDRDAHVQSTELLAQVNDFLKTQGMHPWSGKLLASRISGHDDLKGVELRSVVHEAPGTPTKLSRPPGATGKAPARSQSYVGVRFRRPNDPTSDDTGIPPTAPPAGPSNGPVPPPVGPREPLESDTVTDDADDPFAPAHGAVVAFDIETPSKDVLFTHDVSRDGPWARLCGYRVGDGDVVTTTDVNELIAVLNGAGTITGHNILEYDLIGLAVHHGADYAALAAKSLDTLPVAKQHDPPAARGKGAPDVYDLDTLGERLVGFGKATDGKALADLWKARRKRELIDGGMKATDVPKLDGWALIPTDDPTYREYLRGDVNLSAALAKVLPHTDYTRREQRFIGITSRSRMRGVRIDVDLCHERADAEEVQKREALSELSRDFGLPLSRVKEFKRKEAETIEFDSPLATTEGVDWFMGLWDRFIPGGGWRHPIVPKAPGGRPSTKRVLLEGVMEMPTCPEDLRRALDLICTANGARVVYSTMLKHVRDTGLVHPRITAEQASGRLSITDPGLSVYGKHGGRVRERGVVLPRRPGEVLMAYDFDQVDARGIAAHCQDMDYMDLFEGDLDFHTANAIALFGDASKREMAKKGGHGANYGMGIKGMVKLGVPADMADAFMTAQAERFPVMCKWRQGVRDRAERGELLDNGFGRMMRPDPDRAWTQGPALMGQGTTRDIMVKAILNLSPELSDRLLFTIHDELLFSLPADRADEMSEEIMDAMTFDWAPDGAARKIRISCGKSAPGSDWAACYA